eukprot:2644363-Rhodomonas_salina.1
MSRAKKKREKRKRSKLARLAAAACQKDGDPAMVAPSSPEVIDPTSPPGKKKERSIRNLETGSSHDEREGAPGTGGHTRPLETGMSRTKKTRERRKRRKLARLAAAACQKDGDPAMVAPSSPE